MSKAAWKQRKTPSHPRKATEFGRFSLREPLKRSGRAEVGGNHVNWSLLYRLRSTTSANL
jgi:hypothetical protein